MTSLENECAQIRYDIQKVQTEFQRSGFLLGDEQTVRAALIAWHYRDYQSPACVYHNRAIFRIPSENKDTDLYKTAIENRFHIQVKTSAPAL